MYLPTQEKTDDSDDSDNEGRAYIDTKPINCVSFVRRVITVKGHKLPVTIQLIGLDGKEYLGIKATLFDPTTVSESGFFLTVDQNSWERSEEEKKNIKVMFHCKQDLSYEYYHLPAFLKGEGGKKIFENL